MNIFARFSRNKVVSMDNISANTSHKKLCSCRRCKKQRRKELKISCAFLFPLFAIIAFLSAL